MKKCLFMKHMALLLVILVSATACAKVSTHNTTHPDYGKIIVDDIKIQEYPNYDFKIQVGGNAPQVLTGGNNTLEGLFDEGEYNVYTYNSPEHITISGTDGNMSASVNAVETPPGDTGDFINSMPGWLYTDVRKEYIEKDKVNLITPNPRQQIRELNLLIEPTGGAVDRIEAITGVLSGVAGSIGLDGGKPIGTPKKVALAFTKITSGEHAGKYIATVRLLDVIGSSQNLNITVKYSDDTPPEQMELYDLSSLLQNFSSNKEMPLSLGAQIVETSSGGSFTGKITDWTEVPDQIEIN